MTNYQRVQNLNISNPIKLSRVLREQGSYMSDGSIAATITSRPNLDRGTLASQILSYLNSRVSAATVSEISSHIMRRTNRYSSRGSANRSISQVLLQLGNWGYVTAKEVKNDRGRRVTVFHS